MAGAKQSHRDPYCHFSFWGVAEEVKQLLIFRGFCQWNLRTFLNNQRINDSLSNRANSGSLEWIQWVSLTQGGLAVAVSVAAATSTAGQA